MVLDRDLPEMHGDDVCRALAPSSRDTKVLMLTGAARLDDVVEGLALGADDYLAKPFRFAELVARMRALARRAGAGPRRPCCSAATSSSTRRAARRPRGGRALDLVPKEFGVLEELHGARDGRRRQHRGAAAARRGTRTPTRSPTPCAWPS